MGAQYTAMGASTGNPYATALGVGADFVTGGFSGQQEQSDGGKMHSRWADPYQGALFQQMMQQGISGAGDFGFGQAAKSGNSQLQQMMADRGITGGSGVGLSATGNMLAGAMGTDIANRRNFTTQLLAATPQKQTSKHGWDEYAGYGYKDATKADLSYRRHPDTKELYSRER